MNQEDLLTRFTGIEEVQRAISSALGQIWERLDRLERAAGIDTTVDVSAVIVSSEGIEDTSRITAAEAMILYDQAQGAAYTALRMIETVGDFIATLRDHTIMVGCLVDSVEELQNTTEGEPIRRAIQIQQANWPG